MMWLLNRFTWNVAPYRFDKFIWMDTGLLKSCIPDFPILSFEITTSTENIFGSKNFSVFVNYRSLPVVDSAFLNATVTVNASSLQSPGSNQSVRFCTHSAYTILKIRASVLYFGCDCPPPQASWGVCSF